MKVFDGHFHIIDYDFPIYENQGYWPPNFDIEDYQRQTEGLQLLGGAIVSGSFQKYDQSYLLNALKRLGPSFCGVAQAPFDITDTEIIHLNEVGVRAIRFNIKRGGAVDLSKVEYLAKRVYDLVGWHSEFYIESVYLSELAPMLENLPIFSIDHLGLSEEGLPDLLKWVNQGAYVKATGFGRVSLNVEDTLKSIHAVNPDALIFGTDLPSTRAKRPFQLEDIKMIQDLFDEPSADKILYANAQALYFGKK